MINYSNIFDNEAMSYAAYRELINQLLEQGKTTGPDHSEAMLHYTKMNNQRMNRVEKTTALTPELIDVVSSLKGKYHLLAISEGWCGDAAQILPVIAKVADLAPENLTLKIVLRDQQEELINAHLTNHGKAIPVLLVLDENNQLVLPKWGPRPAILQGLLAEWKKEDTDYAITAEKLHGWYAKYKTLSTQQELKEYFSQLD